MNGHKHLFFDKIKIAFAKFTKYQKIRKKTEKKNKKPGTVYYFQMTVIKSLVTNVIMMRIQTLIYYKLENTNVFQFLEETFCNNFTFVCVYFSIFNFFLLEQKKL